MKRILFLVLLFSTGAVHSQEFPSDSLLKEKCDSILEEAEWLYRFEKAAWFTTDNALSTPGVKESFADYRVYRAGGDTVKSIALNRKGKCIYEAAFTSASATEPCLKIVKERELNDLEMMGSIIRSKMLNEMIEKQYPTNRYDGYGLNMILLPFESGYKLYLIMGTSKRDIIPFGNDYLFVADVNGKITSWRKLHTGLISTRKTEGGKPVDKITHTHLKKEPFITATDICTFRLYTEDSGLKEFSVYSVGLSVVFTYNRESNRITYERRVIE